LLIRIHENTFRALTFFENNSSNFISMKKTFYALTILLLPLIIDAQTTSWLLKGNKGTDPAVNFVGTKDSAQLVFRVNNRRSGYIDFDPSAATTAFGYLSLVNNSSVNNTAFGYRTLFSNTIGQYNTSVGSYSLSLNTTGLGNTAVGAQVLTQNTTGSFNTAVGENALLGNTTGEANVGVGNQTLVQNKTGTDNVAVGSLALYFNTASFNTALGSNALYDNMTGTIMSPRDYIHCIAAQPATTILQQATAPCSTTLTEVIIPP
jgi:hypothetical protein